MKRRTFGLLASTSVAALAVTKNAARAQAATADASLLKTTLTYCGAERAGNAAGTIPAYTGGLTEIPAGIEWDPSKTLPPDFFASDAMLYEVNASNLATYADIVTDGLQAYITKFGFSLKVYPTHRTAAVPQWVQDNIVANVSRAVLNPGGGRLGYTGAFGGTPFPIPTVSDPMVAGAQIIWNSQSRFNATYINNTFATWVVSSGEATLSDGGTANFYYPFYDQNGNVDQYQNHSYLFKDVSTAFAPSTLAGGEILHWESSNPLYTADISWQLLAGQGRVRKAPEVSYDTPSSYLDGVAAYDEYYGFSGAMDRYDWKFLGKKEMLIPYNNNKTFQFTGKQTFGPKFPNPEATRWELHRVWVVEATLHAGERNVLPRRRFYVDEDTWIVSVADSWDASNTLYKTGYQILANFPTGPSTILSNSFLFDIQSGNYGATNGQYADYPYNKPLTFTPVDPGMFLPQTMAASAAY